MYPRWPDPRSPFSDLSPTLRRALEADVRRPATNSNSVLGWTLLGVAGLVVVGGAALAVASREDHVAAPAMPPTPMAASKALVASPTPDGAPTPSSDALMKKVEDLIHLAADEHAAKNERQIAASKAIKIMKTRFMPRPRKA